ncbi:MAG: PfkB family carbohydrate kinase [Acidimicrobiales bacterium]
MTEPARLTVLDSVLIDLTLRVGALPARGQDVVSAPAHLATGGGFNVLVAARRQGLACRYGGHLGTGPFAARARADLVAAGIELGPSTAGDRDLGVCVVVVEPDGERTFLTAAGAELDLSRAALDALDFRDDEYLYLSGYNLAHPSLAATIGPWLATVPERVRVALDPGARLGDADPDLVDRVLARVDWLLASDDEVRALAGTSSLADAVAAVRARVRAGVVVHEGAAGCRMAEGGRVRRIPGVATPVVDSNGAGDTHNGVFLASLAAGADPATAAWRANVAASWSINQVGGASAPSAAQLAARLGQVGNAPRFEPAG